MAEVHNTSVTKKMVEQSLESKMVVEQSLESAGRRRMKIHRFFPENVAVSPSPDSERNKRHRFETTLPPHDSEKNKQKIFETTLPLRDSRKGKEPRFETTFLPADKDKLIKLPEINNSDSSYYFGLTSVRGERKDMEDAVAIHPSFYKNQNFYGVYDGHGCSHVAMKCKERMHEIVKNGLKMDENHRSWQEILTISFSHMDKEIIEWSRGDVKYSPCQCQLRTCELVGSTAVVAIVSPEKIIVANCGDSRAVLCRNGTVIPLSVDHKPDRPDELARIQAAGGYVINRDINRDRPRVVGHLTTSRSIGNNYLKPYVISEPEVTITYRSYDDECLIIASDGLWDVVSNETACNMVRWCLKSHSKNVSQSGNIDPTMTTVRKNSNKDCFDASMLLTRLAMARKSGDNISVVVVDLRRN